MKDILQKTGLAITNQNAHSIVKKPSHWQTIHADGHEAARNVHELITHAQNTLDNQINAFFT